MIRLIMLVTLLGFFSQQIMAQDEAVPLVSNLDVSSPTDNKYIRLSADESALQVAIVRFQPRSGDTSWYVDLVSAVHVADEVYYDDLNKRFKDYDAVLYELVAPEGTKIPYQSTQDQASQPPAADSPEKNAEKSDLQRSKSPITAIQTLMTDILGLRFQMKAVDYSSPHFIHADFSPQEFSESMEARGESIFGMVLQMWRAGLAQQLTGAASSNMDLFTVLMADDKQLALKRLMANEFTNAESMLTALEGPEGSTLVAARNQKALKVLKRTLVDKKPQSVAIFYGAAHMQDFQQRLMMEFDLEPVSVEWIDAWSLTE